MEIGDYGYQKSELLIIAEKIYDLRGRKQHLELELSNEEFHNKYIPKREDMAGRRLMSNLPIIIIIFMSIIGCISMWIMAYNKDGPDPVLETALLFGTMFMVFCIFVGRKLFIEEIELIIRFCCS